MATKTFKTLVISAHADDEAISCGGLIQNRLFYQHSLVKVLTVFGRFYPGATIDEAVKLRARQKENLADSILTLSERSKSPTPLQSEYWQEAEGEPFEHGYYKLLVRLEQALKENGGFEEVIIPSATDVNQDHRFLHDLCTIALRASNLGRTERILQWHGMDGGIPAGANWFEKMDPLIMASKKSAVARYKDEMREPPHPRSLVNLEAHARVCGSRVGYTFAEPYTTYMVRT